MYWPPSPPDFTWPRPTSGRQGRCGNDVKIGAAECNSDASGGSSEPHAHNHKGLVKHRNAQWTVRRDLRIVFGPTSPHRRNAQWAKPKKLNTLCQRMRERPRDLRSVRALRLRTFWLSFPEQCRRSYRVHSHCTATSTLRTRGRAAPTLRNGAQSNAQHLLPTSNTPRAGAKRTTH